MTDQLANHPTATEAFAAEIRAAHEDLGAITAETEYGGAGTEPIVIVKCGGMLLYEFRRDSFLDLVYMGGCDDLAKPDDPRPAA
jgi:hypothetical protein